MQHMRIIFFCWSFFGALAFSAEIPTSEISSKTIVLTCATGELGTAIAKQLAKESNLIITGRSSAKLETLKKELESNFSGHYETCTLDFSSKDSIADFKKKLLERNQPIAGLVLMTPRPNFQKSILQEEPEWLQLFQTTFTGPLEALKVTLPYLSTESKIVIIAGTTSIQVMPEYGPSCIIRRMWATCGKLLSHQLGPQGISVNLLSPGVVLTDFHKKRIENKATSHGKNYEEELSQEVSNIPLGRHAQPSEIAQAVRFLLSEDSNFITGTNLLIDGGITVSY